MRRCFHYLTWALLLLLPAITGTQAAQSLRLEFAAQRPSTAKVFSSDAPTAWGTLNVVDGSTVTLREESGRHYEVRATGWRWSQVQEVPADVRAVQVTPHVDGDRVSLEVSVHEQEQDRRYSYTTTTAGKMGEWLQVLGPAERRNTKVFGTASAVGQSPELYIRVRVADTRP